MANSRAFYERARLELARSRRSRQPLTLLHLDLDGFKHVNDRHGHAAGDRVLKEVARTLQATVRGTDLPARLGGDEFAVLLPETAPGPAQQAASKVQDALRDSMNEACYAVTCSIGPVLCLDPPADIYELLRRADALMYEAKDTGKDRITADVLAARLVSVHEHGRI